MLNRREEEKKRRREEEKKRRRKTRKVRLIIRIKSMKEVDVLLE